MRLLFLILLMCQFSCTTINHDYVIVEPAKFNYIDSRFNPIVKMFIYEATSRGHTVDLANLSITFGNIRFKPHDKKVGYCMKDPAGGMSIKIHAPTWDKLDLYQQEELVFHELGHCLIGREHCIARDNNGPISIMYPRILSGKYYKANRGELVDELFNPNPECIRDHGHTYEIDGQICSSPVGQPIK